MRIFPTSVRTRLTLWYTAALTLPLVAFAVASYLIFSNTVRARTDAFVNDALTVFTRELGAERRVGPAIPDVIRRTLREVRFREVDIVIFDDSGAVVGMSERLPAATEPSGVSPSAVDPSSLVAELGVFPLDEARTGTVQRNGAAYRIMVRPLTMDGYRFRLAGVHDLAEMEAMLRRIRRLFLVAIPLLILCAATGGSFLARRSFRPVSAMATRAAEIGASTLHERLPVVANDELGDLARVLNDLLDRLGRSFEQQRRFMTDASHELRTPTAIVRAEADVTLSRERRTEEEYRASMAIVRDASQRLTKIVDDIFLLARADAGHLVMHPGPLYLDELVRDTVRAVTPIAGERLVKVVLHGAVEAPMIGDVHLLGRLVLNLLDNAIKHSPEGGVIDVSMTLRGSACELSVVDAGPGIPPDAQDRVFERFFRVDVARSREEETLTSGAGLGLSICRRIAEMHQGSVDLVASRPGRTEFRVSLPIRGGLWETVGS
jgi:two-component system OmpR family sensor kinase